MQLDMHMDSLKAVKNFTECMYVPYRPTEKSYISQRVLTVAHTQIIITFCEARDLVR